MKRLSLALATVILSSCAVGPNYRRPQVAAPPQFRGAPDETAKNPKALADVSSFDLFHDDVLTKLLQTALVQNNDVKIAAARVLETRAQYGIQKSYLAPTVDVEGQFNSVRNSSVGSFNFIPKGTNLATSYTQVGFSLAWEIDVWGRLRRLNEAARAEYLASEENRHAVLSTLVADVTATYLSLRELDLELEIANQTKAIAENGLKLTEYRHQRGVVTALDVRQAQQLLYTATAQIAATQRSIAETENALSLLLGQNPGAIDRGKKLVDFGDVQDVPPGLPSALLERRPDIRQAEDALIAANAEIGAAQAEYFPKISLTGFLGGQSRSLSDLFSGPGRQWALSPAGDLPIFNAGRLRNNVRLTEATRQELLVAYQKAIQNAFREVSDALIGYDKNREQRKQEELFVEALRDSDRLSQLRYKGGLDSFLQVLDAERNRFQGELTLARLRRDELISVVQLYRALGGGWR
jgi:multidrug efflux system outer membrane protein